MLISLTKFVQNPSIKMCLFLVADWIEKCLAWTAHKEIPDTLILRLLGGNFWRKLLFLNVHASNQAIHAALLETLNLF